MSYLFMYSYIELSDDKRTLKLHELSGKIINIKPACWNNLDFIMSYIEDILETWRDNYKSLAHTFSNSNETFWNAASTIFNMLQIPDNSLIDVKNILNLDDLIHLFIASDYTVDEHGMIDEIKLPGYICIMHGINFFLMLKRMKEKGKTI